MKSLLDPKQIISRAVQWRKSKEVAAIAEYTKYWPNSVVVSEAGSAAHPFFGASPDSFVNDTNASDTNGLVEVKCPYKYKHLHPPDAAKL